MNLLLNYIMIMILLLVFLLPFFWNSFFSIIFFIFIITLNSIILYFLGIYFLALSLIIIYSGAIPILMIFLIKLIGISKIKKFNINYYYLQFLFLFKFFIFISFLVNFFIWTNDFNLILNNYFYLINFFDVSLFSKIGLNSIDLLYIKDFFYGIFFIYFFISIFLLLISMVGSICIILLPKK